MVDYIDAQIIDIKKIIDDTKNGTSELLSRETIQSLLSKALEEKEESLTNLNTAKTNYKQTQEDFRKSEDKLATIPALRNQLNKLLIERKQSRKVLEMLTELSLKADNENIVSDFSFYKLDDAVFTEGRLGNKLKIFLIGSAFLVFLSSLMLFAISYFRGLVLHNDHLHQPFIESAGRIPLYKN